MQVDKINTEILHRLLSLSLTSRINVHETPQSNSSRVKLFRLMYVTLTLPYFPSNDCYSSGRRETRKQRQSLTTLFSPSTGEVLALKYSKKTFKRRLTLQVKREKNKPNKQTNSHLNVKELPFYELRNKLPR